MNEPNSEVETKKCSNCDQIIEKSKFMIHEAYWVRHMYKWQCGEVVCKAEKEEHEEEKHVSVKCKYCGFEDLKHKFGDHEETCNKKPKLWTFCEQTINFDDFFDHVNFCGSKTRMWEFCHRNIMMRNQKYHEQEEWAKFIREDYEKEQQVKIKELEEEEKRANKVREMQMRRRKEKEEKEQARKQKAPAAASKPSGIGKRQPHKEPTEKRALPSYYNKAGASKSSGTYNRSKPAEKDNIPSSYYKPTRNRDKKPIEKAKEEAKQHAKPAYRPNTKKTKLKDTKPQKEPENKFSSHHINAEDEIPPELLNQIYSEDLDSVESEIIQSQEYDRQQNYHPRAPASNQPEALLGADAIMEDAHEPAPRARARPRRNSPPPPSHDNPMPRAGVESEQELIQRAIAESLKDGNPRMHPMPAVDFDSTMNDPEMLEAIARSMQDH